MSETDDQHRRVTERPRSTETDEEETTDTESADETVCSSCGGTLARDAARGEIVCEDCGLVVEEDEIDRGPEWRAFDHESRERKSRVGAPTTKMMHDDGLSTDISWQDKDAYGNALSARKKRKMKRLRTWNERFRARDARDRNLKQALGEIDRMASSLGLPDTVRETAGVIYRRALDEDLLPGRSIEGVATASLYAAARQATVPRTLDEFNAVSRIEKKELQRTYRYIVRELSLEIEPADPLNYISRFASELGISSEAEQRARELLDSAKRENIHSGKSPVGLAAAALYAGPKLANETVTQQQVSEVADVSEVTIRDRYKELLEAAESTGMVVA
ncbi:MAG: transcription initiation factor IIB family protein [Halobacteriales archaeon]